MPETSRYLAIEGSFTKRAKGDDGAPRMKNHKYAEGVVAKLIGSPGSKFWYGAAVGIVKFATSWFPTPWLVSTRNASRCIHTEFFLGYGSFEGHWH